MLILGSKLIGFPIMGLQTSSRLAITKRPLINPANLKIIAYEVSGPLLVESPSFLRIADIRELSEIGMIIDSSDEIIGSDDVIVIRSIYDLDFSLNGLEVKDQLGQKIGKVVDFNIDTDSFVIQQLHIKPTIFKSLTNTDILIHRNQIIEINSSEIIIHSGIKKLHSTNKLDQKLDYLNPFRQTKVEPSSAKVN